MSGILVETIGKVVTVTLDCPPVNALTMARYQEITTIFNAISQRDDVHCVVLGATGNKAFCAGLDLQEFLNAPADQDSERAAIVRAMFAAVRHCAIPVIAAVNGFAMGGGFMLVERTDLRVAVHEAVFEVSEAKRWLLGGYNHGHLANLAYPIAMEMALGFRFTAERFHQLGFINRLVAPEALIPTAMDMARHMLTLPPAARVNTIHMMRRMRPAPTPAQQDLAAKLHEHGDKSDLLESRAAFAEKRAPNFKGWLDPADRYRMPDIE